jgi:hypothetical protein
MLEVRELPSGRVRATAEGIGQNIRYADLCFSPGGRWLAATDGKSVALLPPPYTKPAHRLEGHTGYLTSLAINPAGSLLASGSIYGEIFIWNLPSGGKAPALRTRLTDLAATPKNVKAGQYTLYGATYVAPCGTPLPPGAVCTCNCVPGRAPAFEPVSGSPAPRRPSYGGGSYCTCNKVCTCVPIK